MITSNDLIPASTTLPQIGMGATVCSFSDRNAYTIVDISDSGKTITLRRDIATRTDSNGMSDMQEYSYTEDKNGNEYKARKDKNGEWKTLGTRSRVLIGVRKEYYDYSF